MILFHQFLHYVTTGGDAMTLIDPADIQATAESFAEQLRLTREMFGLVDDWIAELERENNRLVHELEHPECKYRERARIATELQRVRIDRRKLKDWKTYMRPISDYLNADKGANLQNFLGSYLGAARKAAQYIETRQRNRKEPTP